MTPIILPPPDPTVDVAAGEQTRAGLERGWVTARILLTLSFLLLGLWIVLHFIPALLWALIIAVAVDPLYQRLERRWFGPHRALQAALFTTACGLLIILPVALGIAQAIREATDVAAWIAAARANGLPVPDWLHQLPFGADALSNWWQANLTTPQGAAHQLHNLRSTGLVARSQLIGFRLIRAVVVFAFTLIALFFLLRDRDAVVHQAKIASDRLFGPAGERIGRQAILSVRGTIDGLVLVGIGEGVVMTIAYLSFGVPQSLLLGVMTAVAAMIPFGAAVMFAVAALLMLTAARVGAAIAIVVIGLIVVGIADHFIRPVLIGSATRLPFLWVLIGILGGVETLGLLGLFVGPATMAILVLLWREFVDADGDNGDIGGPGTGPEKNRHIAA